MSTHLQWRMRVESDGEYAVTDSVVGAERNRRPVPFTSSFN